MTADNIFIISTAGSKFGPVLAANVAAQLARGKGRTTLVDANSECWISSLESLSETGTAMDRAGERILRKSAVPDLQALLGFGAGLLRDMDDPAHSRLLARVSADSRFAVFNVPGDRPEILEGCVRAGGTTILAVGSAPGECEALPGTLESLASIRDSGIPIKFAGIVFQAGESAAPHPLAADLDRQQAGLVLGHVPATPGLTRSISARTLIGDSHDPALRAVGEIVSRLKLAEAEGPAEASRPDNPAPVEPPRAIEAPPWASAVPTPDKEAGGLFKSIFGRR